jgi:hypothetical protein
VAQRPTELHIELLPADVGGDLGGQAGQKATQRLSRVALQGEVVLELVYDPSMSWRLPDAQRRSASAQALLVLSLEVAATKAP